MTDIDIKEFMYSSFKNMNDNIKEIKDELKQNTETTEKILLQATKTNGRVNGLEKRLETYEPDKTSTQAKVNWIMGVGAAVVVLGGIIYAFILKDISNQIDQKFNDCCSALQKKTENQITNNVSVK